MQDILVHPIKYSSKQLRRDFLVAVEDAEERFGWARLNGCYWGQCGQERMMECSVCLWIFEVLRYMWAQKLNREYCQQDAIVPSSGYPSISLRCLRFWSCLQEIFRDRRRLKYCEQLFRVSLGLDFLFMDHSLNFSAKHSSKTWLPFVPAQNATTSSIPVRIQTTNAFSTHVDIATTLKSLPKQLYTATTYKSQPLKRLE